VNDEYLKFAKDLAEEAGKIMKKYFLAEELNPQIKADDTLVTAADKEINELVIKRVKARFPDHGVLGEEDSFALDKSELWIVDPLDGTETFARRIPLFAFSLALVSKGKLQVGVVYDPVTERLFYAGDGLGAYENGIKLNVSERDIPSNLFISSWVVGGIENSIFTDKSVHAKTVDCYAQKGNFDIIDLPVAYALAMVGAASVDAMVSSIITPWDVAAGSLIAKEAGAKVTDLFGQSVGRWDKQAEGILVAPPKIHEYVLKTIKPAIENAK